MAKQSKETFKNLSIDKVLGKLSTDPKKGLTSNEAAKRQQQYGLNEITGKTKHPIIKFLEHFWGPIPWMIEIAVILSAVAQRWEDFAVIFVMLLINGGVGFWHENKASNAIEALKEKLAPESIVIRDGNKKKISAKELVPGDIIIISMGNIVPSDAKLLSNEGASIDESALTGESLPVNKEGGEIVYSGTSVKRGEAYAVVTATGRNTKFAKTVELVESAEEKSHFQKAVIRIGYFLIAITGVLVASIIVAGILRNEPLVDILLFALVVTIAGIPQALPAVLSVTMTIGANRLARMKAIVSRLSAMEEMAGLQVLCADKTGTLTKNELEVQEPVIIDAENKNQIIQSAAFTVKEDNTDPIDKAILECLGDKKDLGDYEITDFRPFDPTKKRAEADVKINGNTFSVAKGAPQVILDLVNPGKEKKEQIKNHVDKLGKEGYRSLGVAKTTDGDNWEYLGLLPLLDPPREDSADVIEKTQNHGIDIKMITGDHAAIGKQVAGQIGLNQNIIHANEYFSEDDKEKPVEECKPNTKILETGGFAEVTPEHKFSIIKQFQKLGRIVGMTGDGVNDAPALKQADVGIAVSNATDAARSAAALILTAPGLGVITRAIEEARRIFERMTSYSIFRITESLRVLLFMTLSILAFNFYPVTPIMIVLLAILNDIPIMTIAYDNVPTATKPVRWNMRSVLSIASVLSVGGVLASFILFWYLENHTQLSEQQIQTLIFLKLLIAGHLTLFVTRNSGWFWQKPWPNLTLFLTLEGTQVIGTLVAVYGIMIHPVSWSLALSIWAYSIVWLFIMNTIKVIFIKAAKKYIEKGEQIQTNRRKQNTG